MHRAMADREKSSFLEGWTPLRYPDFQRLWLGQFGSNVGSWMQTVAAQWVMVSLTKSALLLSAIQAAGSIPILLLAVPAGTLGDLVDRKRLIVASQALMLVASAVLALLSAVGGLTPATLLLLLCVIGIGGAASAPTWQTLQPELVPDEERQQAIALGSVNQNLARAIGPAIGGLLLAATSAAIVFLANAASFLIVLAAIAATAIPKRELTLPREHALAAARAGGRFVANTPVLLSLIARAIGFIFPAGAIWALLPLVARERLHLGSGGYGLLLGCVGIGALAATSFGPGLRRRLAPRVVYALACLVTAAAAALLALTHSVPVAVVALVFCGAAWITGLGLLGAAYQGELPGWVKARGLSYYLVAFQGANGIGSLAFGTVAQGSSVMTALYVVAAMLALVTVGTWWLALPLDTANRSMSELPIPLDPPNLAIERGPVVVSVDYHVAPGNSAAFLDAAVDLRRVRRRTGAVRWHLHRDVVDPCYFEESFVVGSWEEHEHQHARLIGPDLATVEAIDALLEPDRPRRARHALSVRPRRQPEGSAAAPDDPAPAVAGD